MFIDASPLDVKRELDAAADRCWKARNGQLSAEELDADSARADDLRTAHENASMAAAADQQADTIAMERYGWHLLTHGNDEKAHQVFAEMSSLREERMHDGGPTIDHGRYMLRQGYHNQGAQFLESGLRYVRLEQNDRQDFDWGRQYWAETIDAYGEAARAEHEKLSQLDSNSPEATMTRERMYSQSARMHLMTRDALSADSKFTSKFADTMRKAGELCEEIGDHQSAGDFLGAAAKATGDAGLHQRAARNFREGGLDEAAKRQELRADEIIAAAVDELVTDVTAHPDGAQPASTDQQEAHEARVDPTPAEAPQAVEPQQPAVEEPRVEVAEPESPEPQQPAVEEPRVEVAEPESPEPQRAEVDQSNGTIDVGAPNLTAEPGQVDTSGPAAPDAPPAPTEAPSTDQPAEDLSADEQAFWERIRRFGEERRRQHDAVDEPTAPETPTASTAPEMPPAPETLPAPAGGSTTQSPRRPPRRPPIGSLTPTSAGDDTSGRRVPAPSALGSDAKTTRQELVDKLTKLGDELVEKLDEMKAQRERLDREHNAFDGKPVYREQSGPDTAETPDAETPGLDL